MLATTSGEPFKRWFFEGTHTEAVGPHAYFGWTEGNPIACLLKFLVFGEGDTAPVTREVLRQTEDDPHLRPRISVG